MNAKGQAGTEALIVISLLLIVFVILAVIASQRENQVGVTKENLRLQDTCIEMATALTQTYFAGPGTSWDGEIANRDINIYTNGFVEVSAAGGAGPHISCTFLGSVDQNYILFPGTVTFENVNSEVVITVG